MVASKLIRIFQNLSDSNRREPFDKRIAAEMPKKRIREAEKALGYTFRNKSLLVKSLTHPSYLLHSKEQINNNQRLEFLGDAVIQLVLTETLYFKFPQEREGQLTKTRSGYARGDYMARIARALKLQDFLLLKPRDRHAGIGERDSSLGDAFESIIGAVYLDSNWETARDLILRLYGNLESDPVEEGAIANPKGVLQEIIQPKYGNDALRYETTKQEGNPHNRVFEITVFCKDETLGAGSGRTKKEASENAALKAIAALENRQ